MSTTDSRTPFAVNSLPHLRNAWHFKKIKFFSVFVANATINFLIKKVPDESAKDKISNLNFLSFIPGRIVIFSERVL